MGQLVEFPVHDGVTVLVEVDSTPSGALTRGLGDRSNVRRAELSFQEAIGRVQPAVELLLDRMRLLTDTPDEVQLEFGLQLSAEAGAFIAAASSTANFRLSMTWRRGEADGTSGTVRSSS